MYRPIAICQLNKSFVLFCLEITSHQETRNNVYLLLKTSVWLLLGFFVLPGWAAAQDSQTSVIEESSLGNTKNVHKAGDLFFSGQFQEEDLKFLTDQKITRVISLRSDDEIGWVEHAAVTAAGMEFVQVPFSKPEELTDEVFGKVRELLKDKSKKTLLHCKSGNRVAGVWLPYRVLDEGVNLQQALTEATTIGLKKPPIKAKSLAYINNEQLGSEQSLDQEQSVNPGINKGYKDPDLDVEKMVNRFELESREIYSNRAKIVAECGIQPGDEIADIGAGTGLFSRLFSKSVGPDGWVYAVDIAPRMVGHIVKEATAQNISNLSGVVCADSSISLPENSVDIVFICDTYHHFEYPKTSLAGRQRCVSLRDSRCRF